MLEEAIEVIRQLWSGGNHSHFGTYYVVENARIYTLPNPLPAIFVAAAGPESAEMAGRIGDGLISTAPKKEILQEFDGQGKMGRPHIGQVTVCWGKSEPEARRTAYEWWRTAALQGEVSQELAIPKQFEQACATVREEDVAKEIVCGPDPRRHIQEIQKYLDAGYEQVYVHQVGPDQEGFFQFYQKEILPEFR